MSKKFFKFITNDERRLDLSKMGLTPNDAIILNLKKSIYEILNDSVDLELIKKSAETDKTVFVIVKEDFPTEKGSIENLDDIKLKHKKIRKIFKKNNNVLFFFGNLSEAENIYGIEDGNITMSDPNYFDNFILEKKAKEENRLILENQRKKEEERLLEETIQKEVTNLENEDYELEFSNIDTIKTDEETIDPNAPIITNDFDKEFEQLNKIENDKVEYPLLDSKEYLLKSIYDFVWRMLILNNNSLQLNDLLYLSVNNFPSLSFGQNEYIRELSNNVDSLFDLVLKLDYKLEFNNKLFYIYLANLFTIINGKCKVNREFLVDMAIWVSDDAREQFVSRTENFMNNNLVSIEKIIYSHFIEFSTLAQGSIPRIKGSLKNEDVHLVLFKRVQHANNRNLFCIILRNLFRASGEIGLNLEEYISNEGGIVNLDSQLKMDVANSYNIFLEEVKNFILLRGSDEGKISKLYNILMSIGIEMIISEAVEVTNVASLVNQEQIRIEDNYFNYINKAEPKNEIINIKYEEIEALYKEASEAEKLRNSNADKGDFDLDFLKDQIRKRRSNDLDSDYGLNSELEFNNINVESNEMSDKIDDYESKIKANIKMIEDQRKMLKEKMEKYSNRSSDYEVIKMK